MIRDSGWRGPIGILNHTDEDAEARLLDNLDGLDWLLAQLDGKSDGSKPKPRSWREPPPPASRNRACVSVAGVASVARLSARPSAAAWSSKASPAIAPVRSRSNAAQNSTAAPASTFSSPATRRRRRNTGNSTGEPLSRDAQTVGLWLKPASPSSRYSIKLARSQPALLV